ncbi:hypothetical protein [Cupriavidus plantarum]|uniref:hypothetical protein n=1 Tax=Cupriavidus plantarum TaxID=942865 RepID=UPI000EB039A6|nr:hypothetical protein [Cupriavidus plantarum]RLK45962.1 hypothetical protein C7417_1993 [Cupriavidus plantarum]
MTDAIRINRSEELALRYVDHLARCLYMALRWSMNFKTGVVGSQEKAISWQSLREDTEVPGRPGFKAIRPSEQQLRRRAKQLEKYGLLRDIGTQLRLGFQCLLADTDNAARKKADTGSIAPQIARNGKRGKPKRAYPQSGSAPKADTHQDPGNFSSLPNPSHACGAEGMNVQPPTPAAREGELDPQLRHSDGGEPSEERHEAAGAVGERRHSENEREPTIRWQAHLAWPQGLVPEHRAEVARKLAGLSLADQQRVLDELQGMSEVTTIRSWWKALSFMIGKAKVVGWEPEHAERVCLRREQRRAELEAQAQAAAEADARRTAAPEGWADRMKRMLGPRWREDAHS